MLPTVFQPPELFDSSGNLIRPGAFGPNTPFFNDHGGGVYDYIANDLEFLYKLAKTEIVPVESLPASGDSSKTYLVTAGTNAGKCYIWTGSAWQQLSSDDVVTRAEEAVADAEDLLREVQAYIAASTIDAAWNSATTYAVGDCVYTSDGSAYRCIQASTNNPPATSPAYWAAIEVVEAKTFEYDADGDLIPCANPVSSANWEVDSDGDIMPA